MSDSGQLPSWVVFDLGKVLVDFDYGAVSRRLAEEAGATAETVHRVIHESGLLVDYEHGRLSTEDFFAAVRDQARLRCDAETFAQFFGDIFTPIPESVALLEALRDRKIPTCLFSNTNPLAIRFCSQRFAFMKAFDRVVVSYEHGAMKPAAGLYAVVERITGQAGQALFFLDDRPENVATATGRGWNAFVFESPVQAGNLLRRAGLL